MEERITRFIAALRASGVRVSVAESQDAWQAIEYLGVQSRDAFRLSLRSTLVKDADSLPVFEELFPQYFGTFAPPLLNPQAEMSPEQQQMLQQMMRQLLDELAQDLQKLLEWLLNGQGPTQEELEEMAEQARCKRCRSPFTVSGSAGRAANAKFTRLGPVAGPVRAALGNAGRTGDGP